jgi:hypothetical protein
MRIFMKKMINTTKTKKKVDGIVERSFSLENNIFGPELIFLLVISLTTWISCDPVTK